MSSNHNVHRTQSFTLHSNTKRDIHLVITLLQRSFTGLLGTSGRTAVRSAGWDNTYMEDHLLKGLLMAG